jgi:hypothetical protein
MSLVASSLSQICKAIAQFASDGLNSGDISVRVTVGNPGDAAPIESEVHRLNLFFFRFEPFAFNPDLLPGETLLIRMHCLMTPFCLLEDSVSAGENDLRVIGEVVRIFHETPVVRLTAGGEDFEVHVIFQNLALDQLNQLWSTQGDVAYRPSVLYEVSLAPVIPKKKATGSPLVGSLALGARADMKAVEGAGTATPPDVPLVEVDTSHEEWAPAICFVRSAGCAQSFSLEANSAEISALALRVWIAGAAGAPVALRWDVWDRTAGWRTQEAAQVATAVGTTLDPERPPADSDTAPIVLPFTDHAGQAVLYAERTYARVTDGVSITVRSNPLLVNVFEVTP